MVNLSAYVVPAASGQTRDHFAAARNCSKYQTKQFMTRILSISFSAAKCDQAVALIIFFSSMGLTKPK